MKIDFAEFVFADEMKSLQISFDMIVKAIEYIKSRLPDFNDMLFIEDLISVIKEVYPQWEAIR